MNRYIYRIASIIVLFSFGFGILPAFAEDTRESRSSMAYLQGVHVVIENMQPNIQKYAKTAGLTSPQIQHEIETRLHNVGIVTFNGDSWLKVPGKPVLYVNINTHETEKFWYAYDIKLELRQVVFLEVNPKVRTFADTWSINITGVANIGNLSIIKKDAMVLLDRFIQAYKAVNRRR
ncbi:MAG: hypothetical protein PHN75_11385 [Syntrophales bacterium]|nr:hypothetical protein [Syntrophales bacterium]